MNQNFFSYVGILEKTETTARGLRFIFSTTGQIKVQAAAEVRDTELVQSINNLGGFNPGDILSVFGMNVYDPQTKTNVSVASKTGVARVSRGSVKPAAPAAPAANTALRQAKPAAPAPAPRTTSSGFGPATKQVAADDGDCDTQEPPTKQGGVVTNDEEWDDIPF